MTKGEDTRRAILDHAAGLASRVGLEALSVGRLAEESGLSKSGLFAHFGSKENIQLAVLEHVDGRFTDEVVRPAFTAAAGEPRLRALLDGMLVWIQANEFAGGCPIIQAAAEFDDRPGPVRDLVALIQRRWLAGLAEGARRAQALGHFRDDLDPDDFAFELYALLLGYHHAHRLLRDPAALRRVRGAVAALMDRSRT